VVDHEAGYLLTRDAALNVGKVEGHDLVADDRVDDGLGERHLLGAAVETPQEGSHRLRIRHLGA